MKISKGDHFYSGLYGTYEVVEYKNCYEVIIKFIETGNVKTVQADTCRKGKAVDTEKLSEDKYLELKNLIGNRFTSLKVISCIKNGRSDLVCECDCGKTVVCTKYNLVTGHDKSCGCKIYMSDLYSIYKEFPHEKTSYDCMLRRCKYDNNVSGKYYKDKGISICNDWLVGGIEGFSKFLKDMGPKPRYDYQLDRIDNEKGYSKDNCRWVNRKVNQNNRSVTILVEILGNKIPLRYVLEFLDIEYCTVRDRYDSGLPFTFVFYKGSLRSNDEYKKYKELTGNCIRKRCKGLKEDILLDPDKNKFFERSLGKNILDFIKDKYNIEYSDYKLEVLNYNGDS